MKLTYRTMQPEEADRAAELVSRTFLEFVAPAYPAEGTQTFLTYAGADPLRERLAAGAVTLIALEGDDLVGMIEMRRLDHISLLFVDGQHQGRGIARELTRRALAIARAADPALTRVTVNSSPNAVEAYRRLGFQLTDDLQQQNGIIYQPMALTLP